MPTLMGSIDNRIYIYRYDNAFKNIKYGISIDADSNLEYYIETNSYKTKCFDYVHANKSLKEEIEQYLYEQEDDPIDEKDMATLADDYSIMITEDGVIQSKEEWPSITDLFSRILNMSEVIDG